VRKQGLATNDVGDDSLTEDVVMNGAFVGADTGRGFEKGGGLNLEMDTPSLVGRNVALRGESVAEALAGDDIRAGDLLADAGDFFEGDGLHWAKLEAT
jgi:hypothetical protein